MNDWTTRFSRVSLRLVVALLFSTISGGIFAFEAYTYDRHEISSYDGSWTDEVIEITTSDPPLLRLNDATRRGRSCPATKEKLLICFWLTFSEVAVVEGFQERDSWDVGGIKFINLGKKDIRMLNTIISDAYLISTDWTALLGEYKNRPKGSFQFIYSEEYGLIGLIRKENVEICSKEGSIYNQKNSVTVSSVYWARTLPGILPPKTNE